MKSINAVIYLFDNQVIIFKGKNLNEIIYKQIEKKAVCYAKVAKPNEFYKQIEKIIKKLHLINGLINNSIICLVEPNLTQADKEILINILEKIGYNKIEFINLSTLFDIKRNKLWIIANNQNLNIVYLDYRNKLKSLCIDYELFNNNIDLITNHLKLYTKRKTIILLGHYPHISDLATKIEKSTLSKTYYIENFNEFIIKNIKSPLNY